jgi:hypothetical protein
MKSYRPLITLVSLLALVLLFLNSCDTTSPTQFEPVTITGMVTNAADAPLPDAIVRIVSPLPERTTVTDQQGNFSFVVDVDSTITFSLEAQKEGFVASTQQFLAIPERNVSLPAFKLTRVGGDDTPEPPPPGGDSANSAFIALQALERNTIQVRETGGVEQTTFDFVVTDSSGTPVSNSRAVYVRFEILSGPGGGEGIFPDSVLTDNGVARGTLSSGTVSGVVQVRASFVRNGILARSNPVSVTIAGGLPDNNHFEVHADPMNVPAANRPTVPISVLLGDKYGNTVPAGTAVYFSTDRGTIDGSATTNAEGLAVVALRTNSTTRGLATVRVETANDQGQKLTRTVQVRYSGKPEMSVDPAGVDLSTLTTQLFKVNLSDEDGNPLAFGTNFEVTVDNDDLQLLGTVQAAVPDATEPGPGITDFEVSLRKPDGLEITEMVTLSFSADGPNGSVSIEFYLDPPPPIEEPPPPGEDSGGAAFISLQALERNTIQVRETGGVEQTTFDFVVTDSSGTPVSNSRAVYVRFEILSGPGGGEGIFPDSVLTDNGVARGTLSSGTVSGVVQVRASFVRNGILARSNPVSVTIAGGLPDNNHFEVHADPMNVPAANRPTVPISVLLGDKYGNTVPAGTAVYFSTDRGTIDGSASTNAEGLAVVALRTNSTTRGLATVRVETANDQGQKLTRTVQVRYSGKPEMSVDPAGVDLSTLTTQLFKVNLSDEDGNPLAFGTNLTVSVDNDGLQLLGTVQAAVPDATEPGPGITDFEVSLRKPDGLEITEMVTLSFSADGPNGSVSIEFYLDPPPPIEEPPPPPPPFTEPASMYLLSSSLTEIGVRGTGQREDTQLTFQVMDVNGSPLGEHNPVEVNFRFGVRPNGGETITAGPISTNADGQVIATVASGTRSGIVQVIAQTQTTTGTVIRSQPAQVVIHAGLPSQQHFSLLAEKRNAAFGIGDVANWTVMVGDRYGNVVPDGTAIYFTTTGGFIQGAAFTTNGRASAQLQVGNPFPAGGRASVTASTANDQDQIISTSSQIIFSQSPIITVSPTSFDIPNANDQKFTYSVKDILGNPMVEGTRITVTVEGDQISVLGDVDITVGGLNSGFSNINQLTDFSFIIDDAEPDVDNDTPVQITIEVSGPNGTARLTLDGRKAKIPAGGNQD